jgi:hypothetical protein
VTDAAVGDPAITTPSRDLFPFFPQKKRAVLREMCLATHFLTMNTIPSLFFWIRHW